MTGRADAERGTPDDVARPLHLFVVGTAASVVVALHHAYRAYALYVSPRGTATAGFAAAFAGLVLGASATWRLTPFAESTVRGALFVAAIFAALSSFAPFLAFDGAFGIPVALAVVAALVGASVTAGAVVHRAAARASLALGLVPFVLAPARLAGALGVLLLVEAAAARAGFLRSGVGVAALLLLAAEAYPSQRRFLHGVPEGPIAARWARRAATAAAIAGALGAAESLLPVRWLARFPDEIVFARDGRISEYAVVASPAGYELYADGQLAVSPLDEARRTASLVRPALGAAERAARVLLLYGGLGSVERAILDDPRVEELVTVTPDPERLALARGLSFLADRARGALESPRAQVVVEEPLAWLGAHPARSFDVIIADLPLPLGYREGKYYTHFAFERLARALGPGGVVVVPGVSDDALAGVLATLTSAGLHPTPYHAPVPTIGIASYAIASRRGPPAIPLGVRGLDVGADLAPSSDGRISTLSDQWVVGAFEAARERR